MSSESWIATISNKVFLNQSIIDLDIRLLQNYYKNLGFYKVKINNSFAEFDEKGFATCIESNQEYLLKNNIVIKL